MSVQIKVEYGQLDKMDLIYARASDNWRGHTPYGMPGYFLITLKT
jgi:hypothetical protein